MGEWTNEWTRETNGLMSLLGIKVIESGTERVEMHMPISADLYQPDRVVHGGATIALLESAASYGASNNADASKETVFGVNVNVSHRKSATHGMLRGVAQVDRREGPKTFWNVAAYDDEGDIVSEGSVLTLAVSYERLAEKAAAKKARVTGSATERAGGGAHEAALAGKEAR
ncbi:MAG: PaaI family thioesterase [Eggerthellaceae bacterium]|jgi:1,4-dihydroxy-2-naphthoyl-CoA hydrolase|nr:PaaI family thioesterase [Eggerthellaceae bacterium]MDR2716192.1 PaaI family thioesterase [Coriobacteriaceae bacterium]